MISRIVHFALHQKLFVWLGLIIFIAGGLAAFKNLPIEAFPDVSDIQVNVITLYPGRAAEEVERQVTIPIETALAGTPNSVRVFSHTQFGLSFMMVTFNDKATDVTARQQIIERLRSVDLPDGVQPELAPLSTAIGEIFRFRLTGKGYTPQELRTLQDWVVEKNLRQVPGVADLVTIGGSIKQYEVNPNLGRMRDAKISLSQLFTALQRGNSNAGGGAVAHGRQQYLLRSLGSFRSSADIANVVVAENNGTPILVKDIAEVKIGLAPPQGLMGQDNEDDIVSGIVVMRKGENPSVVLEALKQKIELLDTQILPKGVKIVPYYDRSTLIDKTLHTVFGNLVEGALLVMAVLYLFLANVRAAAIVALVIPLSLLSTFIGLTWVGIPANLLSLGAMDFGIIVDGAVIVVENIFKRLGELKEHQIKDSKARLHAILQATTEVGRPTVFSMIIIIAAHIPIFTLQRHEGKIFAPMAYTVTGALIGSLILSLTVVPLLCHLLLKKNIAHEDNFVVRHCKRIYEPMLSWALDNKKKVVGVALALLVATVGVGKFLGSEFLPELDEGSMWVSFDLPASVSLDEARDQARILRTVIRKTPEVNSTISKVGRPDDGTDPKLINTVEILVDLKGDKQWRAGYDKRKIIDEINRNLRQLPGIEPNFSQPVRDNILESISQIKGQIVIKVQSDSLEHNKHVADQILANVQSVKGVMRAFIDRDGELPQYVLEFDRAQAARYGINVADVQDLMESALAGKAATELWEGERHFSVVVRLKPGERELPNLPNIFMQTADGAQVPLSQLVTFRAASGAMNISRENGQRTTSIGIFIHDRDMGSVVKDMQALVKKNVNAEDVKIGWSGEFENQERAMARLSIVVPLSVLMIFLLLFNAFQSFKSAALIISNIPFALIGGVFALFLTGIPLSVSAAIGFIALFGQAVLNGVVMVTYFNQLRQEGMPVRQAVLTGSMDRLRTVLMTAMLAMLGLFPMAISRAIGSETQRPLAIVIIGGLITATMLTLIVLPTLYEWMVGRNWPDEEGQPENENRLNDSMAN
ncbi:efflux RND transporter permease subunit [Cupriavidus pauculus]|uniref:efflux RND transporter permease subunit n=1 Tax=Cupriavidus pauculus TaxID=82633 RepID=UPI001EE31B91|nr:CusA/CzcA family heavy metal efflux RND transporter [Cupriavidus pauculus]GJG94923.1 efflux RND transporter permease subunit [Cupriavidus pauculus]